MENRQCSLEYAHVSHQWYVEHGDMGLVTFECSGKQVNLGATVTV